MNDAVARAFVIHRLNDGQVRALHTRERMEGTCMVPAWIHEHFDTKPWGEVPQDTQTRVAGSITAITASAEAQARAKGDLFGVERQHVADLEIRRRNLDFSFQKASAARGALMRGYRQVPEED